jgi:hypothetical protein
VYIDGKIASVSDVFHVYSMEHEIKGTNKRVHLRKVVNKIFKENTIVIGLLYFHLMCLIYCCNEFQ